ncbi:MAG: radical SAM protein [Acidimicrobiia bacterium]|nr:radical SAM protein [Acidimicrobiia bacterium]MDH5294259.1 radical SAM protein [Acidimicrobiia bacterium]
MFGIRFETPEPPPTPADVAGWFTSPPGLYLHIPFCRTICPFCPYNKVRYEPDLAARYVTGLHTEIAHHVSTMRGPFPSLYVGGGTPTMCLDELGGLIADLEIDGERAIEVLPAHMNADGASRLAQLGFNYVSIGVQSFHREVLHHLGRPGSPAQNRAAVEMALGRFDCVDVDLIFDVAYQSPQILLDDLALCFEYGVDQVSTYPLMRFGYTPFGKARHDRRREHELLAEAQSLATERGYERRSVWTFNRLGSGSYTSITRPYYLGMGAGAATFAGRVFSVNHFGLTQYCEAATRGDLPVARVAHLPRAAAAAYRAFWQAYTGALPVAPDDRLLNHPLSVALVGLARATGLAHKDGESIVLSRSGYDRYHDLERWVTYHLIEPLWTEMMLEHDTENAA